MQSNRLKYGILSVHRCPNIRSMKITFLTFTYQCYFESFSEWYILMVCVNGKSFLNRFLKLINIKS